MRPRTLTNREISQKLPNRDSCDYRTVTPTYGHHPHLTTIHHTKFGWDPTKDVTSSQCHIHTSIHPYIHPYEISWQYPSLLRGKNQSRWERRKPLSMFCMGIRSIYEKKSKERNSCDHQTVTPFISMITDSWQPIMSSLVKIRLKMQPKMFKNNKFRQKLPICDSCDYWIVTPINRHGHWLITIYHVKFGEDQT